MTTTDDAMTLAADHGLHLDRGQLTIEEAGLDFQVIMASDTGGQRWVLRLPRRPDVVDGTAAEARALDLVTPVLARDAVAVPDWRIHTPEVIAYPALPGRPGLTVVDGEPVWHMAPDSTDYAARLGRLLALLHSIAPERAAAADIEVRTPEAVRQSWRDDVGQVGEAFVVDPARDFVIQYGAAGRPGLDTAVEAYRRAGGQDGERIARQAPRLWDASPIGYALFALTTGDPDHHAAAQAKLDPRD